MARGPDLSSYGDPVPDLSSFGEPIRTPGERLTGNLRDAVSRNSILAPLRNAFTNPSAALPLGMAPGVPGVGGRGLDPLDALGPLAQGARAGVGAAGLALRKTNPGMVEKVISDERSARAGFEEQGKEDPFYKAPGGVVGKATAGGATLLGQLLGGAVDPTNFAAPGSTLGRRALLAGAQNAASDVVTQQADVQSGVQDKYSPTQTAGAAALGPVLQVGMEGAGSLARAVGGKISGAIKKAFSKGVESAPDLSAFGEPTAAPKEAPVAPTKPAPAQGAPDLSGFGTPAEAAPAPVAHTVGTLWDALISKESGGDQGAVSPKGAFGVAQLMPKTAADMAKKLGDPNLAEMAKSDPAVNERLGQAYLQEQLDAFGDPAVALAAYNAGPARARAWVKKFGHPSEIGQAEWIAKIPIGETKDYVTTILGRSGSNELPTARIPTPEEERAAVAKIFGDEKAGPPPETGEAIWRSKDADHPIEITGEAQKAPDGREYVPVTNKLDGTQTFVPRDEIVARAPEAAVAPEPALRAAEAPEAVRAPEAAPVEPMRVEMAPVERLAAQEDIPTIRAEEPDAPTPEVLASTKGNLRERPVVGAVPAPDPSNLPKIEQNIGALAKQLINDLDLTARQGRITLKNALGTYSSKSGVIRTRGMQELDVLSHEGGHALEFSKAKELPALQATLTANAPLLKTLAYPGAPASARRQEGFAEFFRWYVTNPEHANKIAPTFYSEFERAIAADAPEMLQKLKAVQLGYRIFLNSPSAASAAASVVRPPKTGFVRNLMATASNRGPLAALKEVGDEAYRGIVDHLDPVKRAVEQLVKIKEESTGRRISLPVVEDPYKLLRSLPGVASAGHMDIMHGVHPYHTLEPDSASLSDALSLALGDKFGKWDEAAIDRFGAYLAGRRLLYEHDRYTKGLMDQPPDKFSKDFWQQAIKDYEAANPTWPDAARMVYDFTSALWKKRHDAGLIDSETYLAGLAEHPDYVPLFRDMSEKDMVSGAQGSSTKNAGGVKRFKGSTREIINPLHSLMQGAYELNALIARNDALKALDDLGQTAGPDAGAIVERIPATEMRGTEVDLREAIANAARENGVSKRDALDMDQRLTAMFGEDGKATIYRAGEMNEKGEPIVYVWRDGEKIPLRLPDGKWGKDMLEAIAGMTPAARGLWLDLASLPARALRAGITTHPQFFLANTIRDQMTAAILTDVGYRPFFDQAKGIINEGAQSDITRIYNVLGGEVGGAQTSAERLARVDKDLQALRKRGYQLRRFASWKGFAELTEISESGTRLGIFEQAKKQAAKEGLDPYAAGREAAYTARDYMDFDRHGGFPGMRAAIRVVPFLNAGMQALDKSRRVFGGIIHANKVIPALFGGPPASEAETKAFNHAMKAWTAASALAVGSLALRAMMADDPEYQEVADYLRNTHWVVPLPDDHYAVIPKPFDIAMLSNVMERAYEGVALKDPSAWGRLAEGLEALVVPANDAPVLGIPFQLAKNRDAFGSPIIPDHLRYGVQPQDQYSGQTSELAKAVGDVLNVSPAQLDYTMKSIGGSWARDALKGSDAVMRPGAPMTASAPDMPILGRFIKDWTRGATSSKEFWELVSDSGGKYAAAEGSIRKLMNEDKAPEAVKRLNAMKAPERAYVMMSVFGDGDLKQAHPLIRGAKSVAVISDLTTDLKNGDIRGADLQPVSLTPTERRQAVDILNKMSVAEKRNSLIASGVEGWAQKQPLPREAYLRELNQAAPKVMGALALRMQVEKVADPNQAMAVWTVLRPRLEQKQNATAIEALMEQKRLAGRAGASRFLRETTPAR